MTSNPYSIQEFVRRTLTNRGAIVEQAGYALLEVLVPQEVAEEYFQGKNFLRLAFDFEVAEETADCEFVTYGSYLLDAVTRLALAKGRLLECFVPVERLMAPPQVDKLALEKTDFIKFRPPRLAKQYPMEHVYYQYNFRSVYRYYERQERLHPVLVDMSSGRQDSEVQTLLPQLDKIVPLETRQQHLPQALVISQREAYSRACTVAADLAGVEIERLEREQAARREKELSKVTRYYENTCRELQQRITRTKDAVRREKLAKQIAATETDQKRRENDIREKFSVEVEINLDSIIIYYLPKIRLLLELQQRDETIPLEVVFNPLSRELETPLCPSCGLPAKQLLRSNDTLHCGCQKA